MEQSREYFENLAAKLIAGQITEEEQGQLDAWINARMLLTEYRFDSSFAGSEEELRTRLLSNLLLRIEEEEQQNPTIRKIASWMKYAAAVILFALGFSIYYYQFQETRKYADEIPYTKILPGGNRATLTLADGTTIDLSNGQAGIIIVDKDIKYQNGESIGANRPKGAHEFPGNSTLMNNNYSLTSQAVKTFTLSTPKGGQYQVTLPDGSNVWLNAASTLRYPDRFENNQRVVELSGEAYFEVNGKKDARGKRIPFLVKTVSQEVVVLGTQFNISAYGDETDVKTTLVEGSVSLLETKNGNGLVLLPGEQGVSSNGKIVKSEVDVNSIVSWKNGRFSFDGKTFDQVMRELGRWYDLEISYEGKIPEKSFYGEAFRSSNLSIVMKLLKSADVDYRLEGQKLIIRKKEREVK